NRAEQEHARVMQSLQSLERYRSIKAQAMTATKAALNSYDGPELSASEARMLEMKYHPAEKSSSSDIENHINKGLQERTEAMDEHFAVMKELMSASNYTGADYD
ncbi:hypothetical protein, partial [Chromobacterium sp. ASV23]|uniref:hypothetical protein n=1 Tax=Chromobacterium sp. ASV23 TaxID=2795110 RepID=UPI001E46D2A6